MKYVHLMLGLIVVPWMTANEAFARHYTDSELRTLDRAFGSVIMHTCSFVPIDHSPGDETQTVDHADFLARVATPTGYLAEVRGGLPDGLTYSDNEIADALTLCISNRLFVSDWGMDWEVLSDRGVLMSYIALCGERLKNSNTVCRLRPFMSHPEVGEFHADIANAIVRAMGVGDETTRFIYSVGTNTAIQVGSIPEYAVDLLSIYTNGCDSATSGVVLNATATFAAPEYSSRHFTKRHDLLYLATVPGYERSRIRYDLVTNQVDTASWRRYFRRIKDELDALQESDITTPVFSGTPQR